MEINRFCLRSPKIEVLASALVAVVLIFAPAIGFAQTVDNLRGQLDQTSGEINNLQHQVDHHAHEAATLEAQIAAMNEEIEGVKVQVAETLGKIADVNARIAEVEAKMATKKAILGEYLKSDYYLSQTSTLEILVGSNNLSEFIDRRQYLEAGEQRINDLLKEIEVIKKELDSQKAGLSQLNDQLAARQNDIEARRAARNELLAKTRGEQANYQALLDKAHAAKARLSAAIIKMMGNGPMVSQGFVHQGQVVGYEGSTGFSTGPHLHFGTYLNGSAVNPNQLISSGRLIWPMANFQVSQGFGPANWSNSMYSFHDGIDMVAPFGAPIRAAASGNIIRRSYQPDGFGNYVVIDHGGGLWSLYGHMK